MGKMVTSVCWLPFLFAPKFKFPYVQTCKVTSIYIVKWPSALNAWILGIILTYLSEFKSCICSYTSCITKAQSHAHIAGLCLNLEFRSKPDANTVYRMLDGILASDLSLHQRHTGARSQSASQVEFSAKQVIQRVPFMLWARERTRWHYSVTVRYYSMFFFPLWVGAG